MKSIILKRCIRDFVFGMEDGLVSNLGLVLGVYVGGGDGFTIILAGLASMLAGAFSMSAGSYLSSKSQREVYEHEMRNVTKSLKENPKKYLKEMSGILKLEGFDQDEIEALLHHFEHHNQSTFITNYIQKKVGISEDKLEHPMYNAVTMFFSFLVGSLFPIIPFILIGGGTAAIVATSLTICALFAVGAAKTHYTHRNWFKSGVEIMIVGLGAGIIGYLVGWGIRFII
jgi:vacuolar iron transporter family protein